MTNTTETARRCADPQCGKPLVARGLCSTCHSRATRGQGPAAERAKLYLKPRKYGAPGSAQKDTQTTDHPKKLAKGKAPKKLAKGKAPKKLAKGKAPKKVKAPGRKAPAAGKPGRRDQTEDPIADACIAGVTEFATWMGIKRFALPSGFLLVNEQTGKKVMLTREGELREASLTIGGVLRGGAVEQDDPDT